MYLEQNGPIKELMTKINYLRVMATNFAFLTSIRRVLVKRLLVVPLLDDFLGINIRDIMRGKGSVKVLSHVVSVTAETGR